MADSYPYSEQRANARRWLHAKRSISHLGDLWVFAHQQPRLPVKRLPLRAIHNIELDNEVPALCRAQI